MLCFLLLRDLVNVLFPLRLSGQDPLPREALDEILPLHIAWESYPYTLSGGEQQMLAFLRALVTGPKILLLDEPFSALDYENVLRLRRALVSYYERLRPTIIMVTHNIEEAVTLAHEILVLSGPPTRVLARIENPLPLPRTSRQGILEDHVLRVFEQAIRS